MIGSSGGQQADLTVETQFVLNTGRHQQLQEACSKKPVTIISGVPYNRVDFHFF
jgi:hypothetical protein